MQRQLVFEQTEKGRKLFATLYEAFVVGSFFASTPPPGHPPERKSFDVVRREAKLHDRLCAISEPTDDKLGTGDMNRRLLAGDESAVLRLEQPDIDLLKKYGEQVPWKATSAAAAVDMVDFVTSAPTVE